MPLIPLKNPFLKRNYNKRREKPSELLGLKKMRRKNISLLVGILFVVIFSISSFRILTNECTKSDQSLNIPTNASSSFLTPKITIYIGIG